VFGFYSGYTRIRQVEEYQDAVKRLDAAARKRVVDAVEAQFPPEVLEAYRVPPYAELDGADFASRSTILLHFFVL
jgi:hypothetical protein